MEEDRISSLPDPLIHHILSFLPSIKEAGKTSVLSRRWNRQWTHCPNLIFPASDLCTLDDLKKFFLLLKRTLGLYSCSNIDKFIIQFIEISCDNDRSSKWFEKLLSVCLDFAVERSAKFITFDLDDLSIHFTLPCSFFDNSNVVQIKMIYCRFVYDGNVNWSSLKVLCLGYTDLSNELIEKILSGSPLLESMELHECSGFNRLYITSKNLKRLVVDGIFGLPVSDRLRISSPYIEKLELFDDLRCNAVIVEDLPSLSCATLDFRIQSEYFNYDGFDTDNDDYAGDYNTFESSIVSVNRLLQKVHHAKEMKMGAWFIQILSMMELKCRSSLLKLNCKCVTMNVPCIVNGLPGIAILLQSLPMLEKLTIILEMGKSHQFRMPAAAVNDFRPLVNSYLTSYETTSISLPHLETIEIFGLNHKYRGYYWVLEFVKFLLKNARVVKKLNMVEHIPGTNFQRKVSEKVESMKRSFPDTIIKFQH